MTVFVAVDIGCLECCEPSALLGIFEDESDAVAACESAKVEQEKDWHGSHDFRVFPHPPTEVE